MTPTVTRGLRRPPIFNYSPCTCEYSSTYFLFTFIYKNTAAVFHHKSTVRDLIRVEKMLIYDKSRVEFVDKYRRACKGVRKNILQKTKVGLDETENKMILDSIIVPKALCSVIFHQSC